jgi:hypothetical protein
LAVFVFVVNGGEKGINGNGYVGVYLLKDILEKQSFEVIEDVNVSQ